MVQDRNGEVECTANDTDMVTAGATEECKIENESTDRAQKVQQQAAVANTEFVCNHTQTLEPKYTVNLSLIKQRFHPIHADLSFVIFLFLPPSHLLFSTPPSAYD